MKMQRIGSVFVHLCISQKIRLLKEGLSVHDAVSPISTTEAFSLCVTADLGALREAVPPKEPLDSSSPSHVTTSSPESLNHGCCSRPFRGVDYVTVLSLKGTQTGVT